MYTIANEAKCSVFCTSRTEPNQTNNTSNTLHIDPIHIYTRTRAVQMYEFFFHNIPFAYLVLNATQQSQRQQATYIADLAMCIFAIWALFEKCAKWNVAT